MKNNLIKIKFAAALLSMLLSIAAFSVVGRYVFVWAKIQLAPNMVQLVAAFSISSLIIFSTILLATFIFGRFYCGFVCPLGILQDVIGRAVPAKIKAGNKTVGNYKIMRYGIFVFSSVLLLSGSATAFAMLDPFSIFGRIASGTIIPVMTSIHNAIVPYGIINQPMDFAWIISGAILPLIILTLLVVWKKRIFCTAICPVGTLLGLCAKKGLMRFEIDEKKCISCALCVKKCPVGCINLKNKSVDNERCVRCMECVAICPKDAIGLKKSAAKNKNGDKTDITKRSMLFGGLLAAAAISSGRIIKKSTGGDDLILPPGAGSKEKFLSKCTNCNLCVMGCKGKALRPATIGRGAVHLNFRKGVCEFNCNFCTRVCPTGALKNMPLKEKQRLQIGIAQLDLTNCITVKDKTDCGACSEVCPTGALYMERQADGTRVPRLNPDLCIGCGSCEYACPVSPRPVFVKPVAKQTPIDIPESGDEREGRVPKKDDEWLF